MKRLLKVNIVILLLIFHINTFAQCLYDQTLTSTVSSVYESKNGVSMPTSGTVRILVVPCEVNYTSGITDPTGPAGTTHWPAHSLPDWLDNSPSPVKAFDVNVPTGTATGLFTRYFQGIRPTNYI